ncbi:MAG TPA: LPXTG cell wall anchor domain-containing protein [Nocardioidaceae bacterium]|nr:LPXTG cell wall anchor domain-containing protein [Nocardioidaceae bacterium]
MRSRSRPLRAAVAVLAAGALVVLGPGPAVADQAGPLDPVEDLVGQLQDTLTPPATDEESPPAPADTGAATGTTPSSPPPAPSSDDDLPGHETEDPAPPDHAGAEVADVDVADTDVADVGHNDATVEDDDSTRADSNLLTLGGQEVLAAHADSGKTQESHTGDPLAPLCEGSGGAICLRVLYADAYATETGSTSHSRSRNGALDACVGGSSTDPTAACDGPIGAAALGSDTEAERDRASGRTRAGSTSDAADLCLQQDGACMLGIGAVHSEGHSDSGGSPGTADRDSYLLGLVVAGEDQGRVDDPAALALQPECAEPSLLCVFLNQGESYTGDGIAGHAQEALDVGVLPDTLGVQADVSRTESLVHNDGGSTEDAPAVPGDAGEVAGAGVGAGGPGIAGTSAGAGGGASVLGLSGMLPNTGGVWSGLLALGLLMLAGGAFTIAYSRRRLAAPGIA